MHALKTGLNADKFATFCMFPKRFSHSFVLQMTLEHNLKAAADASILARFRKT